MHIEEIRWDILEELEYRKKRALDMKDNEALDPSFNDVLLGQAIAYYNMYEYIKHYGENRYEDDYEEIPDIH